MLKVMRDSFQQLKWILVFVVVVFVLFVFVDWGAGGARSREPEGFAAKVNGETISLQDYNRALYFTEQRYEQLYGQSLTAEMREALSLPRQVLNGLIEETLLLQEARRLDLDATPAEVRRQILEMPVLSPEGKFVGPELYERYVKSNLGYVSAAAFEEDLRRSVTLDKINSVLRNTVLITPAALEAEYRKRNESAKIRYVLLSADPLIETMSVSPEEVAAYYRGNATNYSHPEQRNVKYLLADLVRLRSQVNPGEPELRARYESMKETFKTSEAVRTQHILIKVESDATPEQQAAAEQKAKDLAARLRAGADLAALAKEHSQDPGSAANGGDLGFLERGQTIPEFDQAIFSSPIGVITGPVKTTYGYHIFRVNEKRAGGYKPFNEVRGQIAQQIIETRAAEMARERLAQLKARLDQLRTRSEEELRKLGNDVVSFNDTGWFGKNDPIPGLGRAPALNAWAFSAKAGDLGQQIDTSRGPIVPYLSATRSPGISPLEEVQDKVGTDLRRERAREEVKRRLESAFAATKTVAATSKQLGVEPVEATVNRAGVVTGLSGNVQPLIQAALSSDVGAVQGPVVVDQGAVIFEVTERKKFDPEDFAKNKDSMMQLLLQTEAPKLRASLLAKLRQRADVEINPRLIQPSGQTTPVT
jgi:peptidyl-prolyl cis-trans isomerase D